MCGISKVTVDVQVSAIAKHLKNIYDEEELEYQATVFKKEIVQVEGSRKVIDKLDLDLDKLNSKPKPDRKVSEKDVIKLFKKTRRLRPEDFRRPMAKRLSRP